MIYRYFPILRWKRGERNGLKRVSVSGATDVIPVFIIGSDQMRGKKPTKSKPLQTPADIFANEIFDVWGARPFAVDASSLSNLFGSIHPLVDIAASCRAIGACLIPATTLTAPNSYQAAVQAINQIDKRGTVLRIDIQELNSAAQWSPSWFTPVNETDLIVDFAVNVSTAAKMTSAIVHSFKHLHLGSSWRTVSIAGTSMPENFGGFTAGLHIIPRDEILLWNTLSSAGLTYRIHFGDYATAPITEPPPTIAWGYPINVRYTLANDFLICRGVKTTGFGGIDMEPQLIQHAQSIAAYSNRGRINCWADDTIDQIAQNSQSQGNLETWVCIGINRHVELIRYLLP